MSSLADRITTNFDHHGEVGRIWALESEGRRSSGIPILALPLTSWAGSLASPNLISPSVNWDKNASLPG